MKLSSSSRHNTPSEEAGEVIDIDVTPVMNMLVVLIPILISMTVFTQYAVHKFYLPPNAGAGLNQQQGPVKRKTTVVVAPEYVLVTLGADQLDSLALDRTTLPRFQAALETSRKQADDSTKVIVSVRDSVAFENVVEVMDLCRSVGFHDVGLSAAPEPEPEVAQ